MGIGMARRRLCGGQRLLRLCEPVRRLRQPLQVAVSAAHAWPGLGQMDPSGFEGSPMICSHECVTPMLYWRRTGVSPGKLAAQAGLAIHAALTLATISDSNCDNSPFAMFINCGTAKKVFDTSASLVIISLIIATAVSGRSRTAAAAGFHRQPPHMFRYIASLRADLISMSTDPYAGHGRALYPCVRRRQRASLLARRCGDLRHVTRAHRRW
jgi:hypothetical protein